MINIPRHKSVKDEWVGFVNICWGLRAWDLLTCVFASEAGTGGVNITCEGRISGGGCVASGLGMGGGAEKVWPRWLLQVMGGEKTYVNIWGSRPEGSWGQGLLYRFGEEGRNQFGNSFQRMRRAQFGDV